MHTFCFKIYATRLFQIKSDPFVRPQKQSDMSVRSSALFCFKSNVTRLSQIQTQRARLFHQTSESSYECLVQPNIVKQNWSLMISRFLNRCWNLCFNFTENVRANAAQLVTPRPLVWLANRNTQPSVSMILKHCNFNVVETGFETLRFVDGLPEHIPIIPNPDLFQIPFLRAWSKRLQRQWNNNAHPP